MFVKDRLRLLLKHFGDVTDPHDPAKVMYPMREVLFLVTRASISGCEDYDEIAEWGVHHLDFLRTYGEYYFGTPKEDWLRTVLNRIDPTRFEACFMAWATSFRPDAPTLIALDGKTLRRSGDSASGQKPLQVVSAWASAQRLDALVQGYWVLDKPNPGIGTDLVPGDVDDHVHGPTGAVVRVPPRHVLIQKLLKARHTLPAEGVVPTGDGLRPRFEAATNIGSGSIVRHVGVSIGHPHDGPGGRIRHPVAPRCGARKPYLRWRLGTRKPDRAFARQGRARQARTRRGPNRIFCMSRSRAYDNGPSPRCMGRGPQAENNPDGVLLDQASRDFTRAARREILRAAVLRCSTPLVTPR
ncbi:ISAs1 family transposase [Roseospira marina]